MLLGKFTDLNMWYVRSCQQKNRPPVRGTMAKGIVPGPGAAGWAGSWVGLFVCRLFWLGLFVSFRFSAGIQTSGTLFLGVAQGGLYLCTILHSSF